MRYCPYCQRFNSGRPQLCYYCGHTWHVRLCPRGHENPPDAQFCGTCGSADLTETSGPRPLWVSLVWIGILAVLVILLTSLPRCRFNLTEQGRTLVVAIVILFMGLHLALSHLPGPIKRPILSINRIIKRVTLSVIIWFWEKLKLMIS